MNQSNFEDLMNLKDGAKFMDLSSAPSITPEVFANMTKEEKLEVIRGHEKPLDTTLQEKIHCFILEQRVNNVPEEKIQEMVKSEFKITVI